MTSSTSGPVRKKERKKRPYPKIWAKLSTQGSVPATKSKATMRSKRPNARHGVRKSGQACSTSTHRQASRPKWDPDGPTCVHKKNKSQRLQNEQLQRRHFVFSLGGGSTAPATPRTERARDRSVGESHLDRSCGSNRGISPPPLCPAALWRNPRFRATLLADRSLLIWCETAVEMNSWSSFYVSARLTKSTPRHDD